MTLNPDDAHCFPVCQSCGEAGVCASGKPAETLEKPSPNAGWAPNRLPLERLTCGCTGIPWPAVRALGASAYMILCERHGWVKVKHVTSKKTKQQIPGQDELVPF